jgi:hypothetical protein
MLPAGLEPGNPGWGALCEDTARLILSKLSLMDLARVATTCRAFLLIYQDRLMREEMQLGLQGVMSYSQHGIMALRYLIRRRVSRNLFCIRPWVARACMLILILLVLQRVWEQM